MVEKFIYIAAIEKTNNNYKTHIKDINFFQISANDKTSLNAKS